MRLKLNKDQVSEIIEEWFKDKYGSEINFLMWIIDEKSIFEGVVIDG